MFYCIELLDDFEPFMITIFDSINCTSMEHLTNILLDCFRKLNYVNLLTIVAEIHTKKKKNLFPKEYDDQNSQFLFVLMWRVLYSSFSLLTVRTNKEDKKCKKISPYYLQL